MLPPSPGDRSPAELLAFGVVNLDKPPGPSAHQVTAWVRDLTDQDRAAHAGTLDPKVTGSLPILLGRAGRAARVFDDAIKEYVAVLELQAPPPTDLGAVLAEFEGDLYQTPPRKSAVVRERRVRRVHDLSILDRDGRQVLIRIRCASGTYIRKLCHDLGLALGTGAHMGDLRRTATGTFDDTDLVTMHDLADAVAFWRAGDAGPLRDAVRPAERALSHLPRVVVAPSAARELAEGAPLYAPGALELRAAPHAGADPDPDRRPLVVCLLPEGAAVALGTLVDTPGGSGTVVETDRVLV